MINKINISDINPTQLDSVCAILVGMFARELESLNGTILKLENRHILSQVVTHARCCDDPKIQSIYKRLKRALCQLVNSRSLKTYRYQPRLVVTGITQIPHRIHSESLLAVG